MTEREYGIWSEFAEEELLNNQPEEEEDDEQDQELDDRYLRNPSHGYTTKIGILESGILSFQNNKNKN